MGAEAVRQLLLFLLITIFGDLAFSQYTPCSNFACDSLVVKKLLEQNRLPEVKVIYRIKTSPDNRIIELDLEYLGLDTLSPEINRLNKLSKLYLNGNNIEIIPEELNFIPNSEVVLKTKKKPEDHKGASVKQRFSLMPHVGINLSKVKLGKEVEDAWDSAGYSVRWKFGYNIGLAIDYLLYRRNSKQISVSSGLSYETKGFGVDEEISTDALFPVLMHVRYQTNFQYLQFPITINFLLIKNPFELSIGGGPEIGFLTSAKIKYTRHVSPATSDTTGAFDSLLSETSIDTVIDAKDNAKSIDWSGNCNLHFGFPINRGKVVLGIHYIHGFTSIPKNKGPSEETSDGELYNRNFKIFFGYQINLGRSEK